MNDSPAACAMTGVSLVWTKLLVFGLSAGLAGLAGALYGGVSGTIVDSDFQMLASLAILLLATVWGIRSVAGVLFAGLSFVLIRSCPMLRSGTSSTSSPASAPSPSAATRRASSATWPARRRPARPAGRRGADPAGVVGAEA